MSESVFIGLGACIFGSLLIFGIQLISQPIIESTYGLYIPFKTLDQFDLMLLGSVLVLSVISGAIPAYRAYKRTLSDGLTIKM